MLLRAIHGGILNLVGCLALAGLAWAPVAAGAGDAGLLPGARAAAEPNADILGRWRLTRVLDAADIAAMSDRQARALIGKTVVVAKDKFVFNGEACASPTYERSVNDLARSFREQGHVSSANMGLPDPVTAIDARCTYLFLKKPGRIVVHWNGFYFEAVRRGR
ncbi:hypothetical protein [Janthinobacterium fluminis]|uniref:Uncharacterized protein n=1 Tax=Janthinobacterium fluminis TaxID=2987524 RepID=A0ABT5K3C3_9BURK|nr:hypothetical protein [Janthinobacterium fluminis]MDC8759180.1 hypothetical protein [Janthinobacterium fluminis]